MPTVESEVLHHRGQRANRPSPRPCQVCSALQFPSLHPPALKPCTETPILHQQVLPSSPSTSHFPRPFSPQGSDDPQASRQGDLFPPQAGGARTVWPPGQYPPSAFPGGVSREGAQAGSAGGPRPAAGRGVPRGVRDGRTDRLAGADRALIPVSRLHQLRPGRAGPNGAAAPRRQGAPPPRPARPRAQPMAGEAPAPGGASGWQRPAPPRPARPRRAAGPEPRAEPTRRSPPPLAMRRTASRPRA